MPNRSPFRVWRANANARLENLVHSREGVLNMKHEPDYEVASIARHNFLATCVLETFRLMLGWRCVLVTTVSSVSSVVEAPVLPATGLL
jgi:hypothetical protein